jgi:4-amino-4-deoxy-L-arabinose transferase-like glycosyltransferase
MPVNWSVQNLKSKIQNHPAAALTLLTFIILAVVYSLVTPPFEAGDESRHYAVVKYMADTGRLPVQESGEAQIHWSHEGNQPPLYYALAAALTFWIDTGGWNDVYWYNPHTTIGDPLRPDNKNITIHPPGEAWPWRSHVLAVHLIRFLSIAMATVTVIACYVIALSLFKGNRRLAAGAMAITAFNPMFIFISSSVNNDNAVIMFVTLALWLMVHMANGRMGEWKNGFHSKPTQPPPPHATKPTYQPPPPPAQRPPWQEKGRWGVLKKNCHGIEPGGKFNFMIGWEQKKTNTEY